jgi:hypothetical protein
VVAQGALSARLLDDLQKAALAAGAHTVVLVEGLSDWFALEAAARVTGRDLSDEGVAVTPMGGATNLSHFVRELRRDDPQIRLVGLCDRAEERLFSRSLAEAFFVCDRDLEDELIRAVGTSRIEDIIESEGDLDSFRLLQQMPFHREGALEDQLHRFFGVRSGRKYRYAPLLVDSLVAEHLPQPLARLLAFTVER